METVKVLVTSKGIYGTKGKDTYEVPVGDETEMSKEKAEGLESVGRVEFVLNKEVESKPKKTLSRKAKS